MAQTKKTKTQTGETKPMSDVMNDWMRPMTDPKTLLEAQRKIAMASFSGLLQVHEETRKATEDGLRRSAEQMDGWFKPMRQATEEMSSAGFDLGQRALEVSRDEVQRWYDTILPS